MSATNRIACPLCASQTPETIYRQDLVSFQGLDHSSNFELALCTRCNFLYQESAYKPEYADWMRQVYAQFYKSQNLPFPYRSEENTFSLDLIAQHCKMLMAKQKFVNVLEIGSNRGDLLYLLKERLPALNVLGLEPSHYKNLALPTIRGIFQKDIFSNCFDLIIMQHVLEHMLEPKLVLLELRDLLTAQGLVYIELPNIEKSLLQGIDDFSLEHVSYFNPSSLSLAMTGFTLIEMNEDSFLRSFWGKKEDGLESAESCVSDVDLYQALNQFLKKKQAMLERITALCNEGRRVVFYGTAYYFRKLYRELIQTVEKINAYYYDDNFSGEREQTFGLAKIDEFKPGDVVIICSNNFQVQQRIAQRLERAAGLIIMQPWNRLEQKL